MRDTTVNSNAGEIRQRLTNGSVSRGERMPSVAWFGDSEAQAMELGRLVQRGTKRATAGLLWKWRHDGRQPPRPGDRQVIVDWHGKPLAVIEMTDVAIVPFNRVDEPFAREEGEGDRSLGYWRRVHWDFFSRECARIGREPTKTMPVICMRFRLLDTMPEDRATED